MMKLSIASSHDDFFLHELKKEWIDAFIHKNLFKLFVPKTLNGLEKDLKAGVDDLIVSAQLHPSLGWVHNLCSGANYFAGCFDETTAKTLFAPARTITCGSGTPSGTFKRTLEGYSITGKWDKCSGANHASLFTVTASNGNEHKTFIVPKNQVSVEKSWDSFGLRATSSDTIVLENALVPHEYAFEIGVLKNATHYAVYHYPFDFFARICLSATYEGIARLFLATCKELFHYKIDKLIPVFNTLSTALDQLYTTRNQIITTAELHEDKHSIKNEFYTESYTQLSLHHFAIYKAIMEVYWKGGIQLSQTNHPCHQLFKDVLTASQHYMLKD